MVEPIRSPPTWKLKTRPPQRIQQYHIVIKQHTKQVKQKPVSKNISYNHKIASGCSQNNYIQLDPKRLYNREIAIADKKPSVQTPERCLFLPQTARAWEPEPGYICAGARATWLSLYVTLRRMSSRFQKKKKKKKNACLNCCLAYNEPAKFHAEARVSKSSCQV